MDTDKYTEISYFENDPVRALILNDDVFYVGAESGLYAYRWLEPSSSTSISRLCSNEIYSLASGTGKIWVGTKNGLGAYDPGSGRYLSLNPDLFNWGRTLNVIPALYEQNDSTLWIGTASSLLKCDPRDMSTSKASTLSVVKTICPISECTFFLGTDNGLMFYDDRSGTTEKIMDVTVSSWFSDRKNDIWLATDNGLFIDKQSSSMLSLDTSPCPAGSQFITLLSDTSGRIWAGGNNGIALFRSTGDRGYLKYDEATGEFGSFGVEGAYNWFYDLLMDGNYMWIASYDGLICLERGELKVIYSMQNGLSSNDIAQIAKDRAG